MTDKRQFHRLQFNTKIEMQFNQHVCSLDLLDISLHGALVAMPAEFQPEQGQQVEVSLPLHGTEQQIDIVAHIQHIQPDSIGLEFDSLDIDSISRLRRLLEINVGDEHILHRDLAALIG